MYGKWAEGNDLVGIRHCSEDTWRRCCVRVGEVVIKLLEKSQKKWRAEGAVDGGLEVAIDCRWSSRGFNAEEGTVICCCLKTNKILFHCNLMRSGIIEEEER